MKTVQRNNVVLAGLLAAAITVAISCEREERDFHVDPAAANTTHTLRLSELQPGTTRPSPAMIGAPTQSPTTFPVIATTQGSISTQPSTSSSILPGGKQASTSPTSQPVGYAIGILPGSPPATSPTTGPTRSETKSAQTEKPVGPNDPMLAWRNPNDVTQTVPPFDPGSQQIQEAMGKIPPPPQDYGKNAHGMSEGKRLYSWFNCVGCHANGGGGMGPALIDDQWAYGSAPDQVYASIAQGRPNGMPAWGGRIPDYEIWQLAHYVRSMSGLESRDAASGRNEHMRGKQAENSIEPSKPKNVTNSTQ